MSSWPNELHNGNTSDPVGFVCISQLETIIYKFCLSTEVPRHSAGSNHGRMSSKARAVKQHVDQQARGGALLQFCMLKLIRVRRNERARTRSS